MRLIKTVQKKEPNYLNLYTNAFIRTLDRIIGADKTIDKVDLIERQRAVFYGMRMFVFEKTEELDYDGYMHLYSGMQFVKAVVSTMTPNEFEAVFPIDKTYDGERYECKDYFYTKKEIKEMGEDKEIGEKVNELFWDYQNLDVKMFHLNFMSVVDGIRRAEGQKGMMEEFLEEQGVPMYRMFKDENGKEFLQNTQTGEVSKVRKATPRYLKVIK